MTIPNDIKVGDHLQWQGINRKHEGVVIEIQEKIIIAQLRNGQHMVFANPNYRKSKPKIKKI